MRHLLDSFEDILDADIEPIEIAYAREFREPYNDTPNKLFMSRRDASIELGVFQFRAEEL